MLREACGRGGNFKTLKRGGREYVDDGFRCGVSFRVLKVARSISGANIVAAAAAKCHDDNDGDGDGGDVSFTIKNVRFDLAVAAPPVL